MLRTFKILVLVGLIAASPFACHDDPPAQRSSASFGLGPFVPGSGGSSGGIPSSRTITAGTGLTGGGDLSADRTLAVANTAVTPASYTYTSLTVDQQGRITSAANGTTPAPATRTITAGTGLSGGGDLSADRTLTVAIAGDSCSAGSYTSAISATGGGTCTAAGAVDNATTTTLGGQVTITDSTGATAIPGLLTATGGITTPGALLVSGWQADTSTGAQNDIVLTSNNTTVFRWAGASTITISGFKCGAADCTSGNAGRLLVVVNTTANALQLVNDATSIAGNRILTLNGTTQNIKLGATNSTATLIYDGTSLRWRMIAMNSGDVESAITFTNTNTFSGINVFSASQTFNSGMTLGGGHISVVGGAAPSLTSCGTGSPTITGSDIEGRVVEGTTATGCVITFAATYTTIPACIVEWEANPVAHTYSVSATAITLTNTSATGDIVHYICGKAS